MTTPEQSEISVTWSGPFSWLGGSTPSLFESPESARVGIYFWTAEVAGKELVYYVGQTEKSFSARHYDHWTCYFNGAYTILDPEEFLQGRRHHLYSGFAYRKPASKLATPFIAQSADLIPKAVRLLSVMRIWLGEFNAERRLHRRIEASVIQALYDAGGQVGEFQGPNMRRELRRPNEAPVLVNLGQHNFAGLGESVVA